jgi:SAM-dependent methyltransferase
MAGRRSILPVQRWLSEPDASDTAMLAECRGSTLDVGCGPGRMTTGLLGRGHPALGVDPVAEAVRLARRRGAPALVRSVFEPIPAEGRWDTVLLADGNIGIGGDPTRLLRRATTLLGDRGRVVAEVRRPGLPRATHAIRLEVHGVVSEAFAWATVPADQLAVLAESAALRLLRVSDFGGRWVATLEKDPSCW